MDTKKKIMFIRSNACAPDPRVERAVLALSSDYDITILAWDRECTSKKNENVNGYKIKRLHLKSGYGNFGTLIKLPFWMSYIFINVFFSKCDVVHTCDFDTMFAAFIPAKLRHKKIVYDIFDFYPDMIDKLVLSPIIRWFDLKLILRADLVILADRQRLRQIAPAIPKNMAFIYNVPAIDELFLNRLKAVQKKPNYFFYGGLLSEDKMIPFLLEYFSNRPDCKFELAGWGPLESTVIEFTHKYSNIHFCGKISHKDVLMKSAASFCNLAFYDPKIRNNCYASPNKLFEAIALGIPIITNKGTILSDFIEKNQIGVTIFPSKHELYDAISSLDHKKLKKIVSNMNLLYKDSFNWQNTKKIIITSYKRLWQ